MQCNASRRVHVLRKVFFTEVCTLQQESSAKNTKSGKSRATHCGRHSSGALGAVASGRSGRGVLRGSGDSDTVTGAGLNAGSRASGHSGSDDGGSSGAGFTSAPGGPRSLGTIAGPA